MTMQDRVARYRYRAEELRVLAQDWTDSRAQAMILEIANDYEHMADTASKLRLIVSDRS
ncbi:MAG TPA: hypothetical protein VGK90_05905 [Rhizomicrobium sp.]|jgi:uncharacterized protein with PhoU and TrkA domain